MGSSWKNRFFLFLAYYREVVKELLSNKVNLVFMVLALVLSLTAINTIYALGKSAEKQVLDTLANLNFGKDALLILAGGQRFMGIGLTRSDTLKLEDAKALEKLSFVKLVSPTSGGTLEVSYKGQVEKIRVEGVFPVYAPANTWNVKVGRFIEDEDIEKLNKVVVLGSDIPKKFGIANPIGDKILIAGQHFTIVGILEEKPSFGHHPLNERVFVPFTTAQRRLFNRDYITAIKIVLQPTAKQRISVPLIRSILRQRHNLYGIAEDDFRIITPDFVLARFLSAQRVLQTFLLAISLISLIISGVVILNLMSAMVEEKAGIIALRRALGATNRIIFIHYIAMSLTVALFSGFVGWLLSLGVMHLISAFTPLKPLFSWTTFGLSLIFSVATSLIFSVIPATRATKVEPAILLKSL
jgi:putative ABC transport system permease protein